MTSDCARRGCLRLITNGVRVHQSPWRQLSQQDGLLCLDRSASSRSRQLAHQSGVQGRQTCGGASQATKNRRKIGRGRRDSERRKKRHATTGGKGSRGRIIRRGERETRRGSARAGTRRRARAQSEATTPTRARRWLPVRRSCAGCSGCALSSFFLFFSIQAPIKILTQGREEESLNCTKADPEYSTISTREQGRRAKARDRMTGPRSRCT